MAIFIALSGTYKLLLTVRLSVKFFCDKESLHGYAVREKITTVAEKEKLSWGKLYNMLYTKVLGVREQGGGLVIYNFFNPESVSVKSSDVHSAISLPKMIRRCGEYQPVPPVYNQDRPENGMLGMEICYMPQLHVRDQKACREARAIGRDILRAHYDAYRAGWYKPDLRAGERFRQIASHCVMAKERVLESIRDPLMRKLIYRVAEFEKMKAIAELRLQLRDERQQLKDSGTGRPLSWKSWVEREALQGYDAAISQMRGWAYCEKRNARKADKDNLQPEAVVYFCPGDDALALRNLTHDVRLLRDGTVQYQRN
ncbi:hypothetical protein [Pantoea septica]|uniref:hypothetical protein n=1 Tax=Pantoea septica TaxID=472695 RepID=UPI000684607B|nr:hypothetical protein [Pantoea septica]